MYAAQVADVNRDGFQDILVANKACPDPETPCAAQNRIYFVSYTGAEDVAYLSGYSISSDADDTRDIAVSTLDLYAQHGRHTQPPFAAQ